mmetsp:Transcript_37406/g.91672  ORF Transcript_37406/g.91672 Transcript_37406/m.91672 type:complete len:252 (+) Transcript_37406:123-878(+)
MAEAGKAPVIDRAKFDMCLAMMARPEHRYVTVSEMTSKTYGANIKEMVLTMQRRLVEDYVGQTYGLQARRIFTQLLARPRIEQKQIAEGALLPLKVAREIVYRLMKAHLLSVQEVPQGRGADYKLSKSFFLFYVDMAVVVQTVLEKSYQCGSNLMLRVQNPGEGQPQVDVLERTLLRLDESICPLHDFPNLTVKTLPPCRKKIAKEPSCEANSKILAIDARFVPIAFFLSLTKRPLVSALFQSTTASTLPR